MTRQRDDVLGVGKRDAKVDRAVGVGAGTCFRRSTRHCTLGWGIVSRTLWAENHAAYRTADKGESA